MAVRYVTILKFSELTGYTVDAIKTKIRDGVWLEGRVWRRAPDGRTLIDIEGYQEWVEEEAASQPRRKRASRSPSPIEGPVAASASSSSPPPLI